MFYILRFVPRIPSFAPFFTLLLFLHCLLFPELAKAQGFVDLKHSGGDGYDFVHDFVMLPSGESYMVGEFSNLAQFGGQGLGFVGVTSEGNKDVFVAKNDADGNVLWVKRVGGKRYDSGKAIALASDGGFCIAGSISDTVHFETATLTTGGSTETDLFVARYDVAGNELWVRQMNGPGAENAHALAMDANDNVYLAGSFDGRITVAPDSDGVVFTYESRGSFDMLLAKYAPSGELLWAQQAGGSGNDAFMSMVADDAGNCYAAGVFADTLSIADNQFVAEGGSDFVITRFTNNGDLDWLQRSGGNGMAAIRKLHLLDDKLYACGYFDNALQFNGQSREAAGASDLLLLQLNTAGNVDWLSTNGGTNVEQATAITATPLGGVWITGLFFYNANFDALQALSAGDNDAFVAHYDNAGNFEWVRRAGGNGYDLGVGIGANDNGLSYLVGNFSSDFSIADTTINAENLDIFMLLSTACDPAASAPSATANSPICAGESLFLNADGETASTYLWTGPNDFTSNQQSIFIAETFASQSGTYTVITENEGCPGLPDEVEVEIKPAPSPVIFGDFEVNSGDTITYFVANDTLSTYEWEVLGGAFLEGSDSSVVHVIFSADELTAQVCVTQVNDSQCAVTDCTLVGVGVTAISPNPNQPPDFAINLKPNPANSLVMLGINLQKAEPLELRLLSLSGKVLWQSVLPAANKHETQISVADLPSGIYILQAKTAEALITRKLAVKR